ncbi:MAG: phosphate regulon sensor histidine kinase PhoR [Burkholderiaceae bacterium]|nr:phosphate regulon sensor histidine kinase PhoR [Burkholderiaceae bacterium]
MSSGCARLCSLPAWRRGWKPCAAPATGSCSRHRRRPHERRTRRPGADADDASAERCPVSWVATRVLAVLGAGGVGALAGLLVGGLNDLPRVGAVAGAALAIGAIVGRDAWRGRRLLKWLRGALDGPAPRDAGFWGEVGYRIEKGLKARERRAEAERERLAQFLSAMEASPNGVLLIDADEQIDWCNSVAALHFDLQPDRDRRQRVTNLVRSPAFKAHLDAGRWQEPVVFVAPDGHTTLSVVVRPYGGGLKLVLSQDITERERHEAMRRDFVANVSHEIRSPLTVLSGFVESMATLPLDAAERQRVLALMGQQTERMKTLVADLLTLAQLEGSPRPAPDRWVPLPALIDQALSDARALSAGRHHIAADVAQGWALAGSESELLSAVGNLLSNAVHYTPDGGRIRLSWLPRVEGGGAVEVVDTGPGIAREHLPRLTERFYRVDGSRSRETGGTGLGLSIVKHVMQRHGGAIEVDSTPGAGSTFRLVFPPARVRRDARGLPPMQGSPVLNAAGDATAR